MRKKEIPIQYKEVLLVLDNFLEDNTISICFQNNKKHLIDLYNKRILSKTKDIKKTSFDVFLF